MENTANATDIELAAAMEGGDEPDSVEMEARKPNACS